MGKKEDGLGIQGSLKAFVSCPFPILLLKPLMSKDFPQHILLQLNEGQFPSLASKKFVFKKYLALKTWLIRELGLISNLHACLSNKA